MNWNDVSKMKDIEVVQIAVDYWLEKDESELQKTEEGTHFKELAAGLKKRLEQS